MGAVKLPDVVIGLEAKEAIQRAISDVAERSFFALADPCDDERFEELAASCPTWLVATVQFGEGPYDGSVSLTLPTLLAERLYDAFSGRDPDEPPACPDQLADLASELTNMICGTWLTRAANDASFSLNKVDVTSQSAASAMVEGTTRRITLSIDELPLIIDVRAGEPRRRLTTVGGA